MQISSELFAVKALMRVLIVLRRTQYTRASGYYNGEKCDAKAGSMCWCKVSENRALGSCFANA